MMEIRIATESDIPAILDLLRVGLGESTGLRTAEFWRWKHIDNPFGPSPVLLAEEDGRLIGIRAFLQWRFRFENETFQAWRAVDTAIHPERQGRGLFTRLTTDLLEQLESGPPAVVFNTPNQRSMPGYLKMGWQRSGKTPLLVKPFPLNFFRRSVDVPSSSEPFPVELDNCLSRWHASHSNLIRTDWSRESLGWRYHQVPRLAYDHHAETSGEDFCLLICRSLKRGRLRELRIVECFSSGDCQTMKRALNVLTDRYRPDVLTILQDGAGRLRRLLPAGFLPATSFGLDLTVRELNDPRLFSLFRQPEKRYLSAGTLELF